MKRLSKLNWLVIGILVTSGLYFLQVICYISSGGAEVNILSSSLQQAYSGTTREIDIEEILKLKTEFPSLWRDTNKSKIYTNGRDRVNELENWTKALVNSRFLRNAKPKRILVFDGFSSYYSTQGQPKCPFLSESEFNLLRSKCIINEANALAQDYSSTSQADVFVSVRNWKPIIIDQKISSVQHVYYIEESPFVTKYAHLGINNAILSSYWRGSDIVLPYGYYHKKNQNGSETAIEKNWAEGKTKLAAIIVSNCEAINERLKYVRELQKYVEVDVYGKCGTLNCENGSCFQLLKKDYKFYLAFEKANCRDYITEKFWINAIRHDTIPVVMGAHPEDYLALAPPNSYIHVQNFENPKELAEHMKLLDGNDTLYNQYFKYKEDYKVEHIWEQFFCRLCSIIHYGDIVPHPLWEEDASWKNANKCLERGKWYW